MSNFTAICPIFPYRLFLIRCSISKATVVLPVISLSETNALCASEIMFGRMFFNLLARTFETNREETFAKLTGQYSVMCCGSFFLGISSIWVKFIFRRFLPEWRTNNTAEVTSSPTMLQKFWKKNGDIPSEPSTFDGCIWKSVVLTSSTV